VSDPQDPKISVPKHIDLLQRMINRAMLDLPLLNFKTENAQHIALACLYCTILQSVKECCSLLAQPTITAPAVIRTIVESHADLCALIRDEHYVERMLATFYREKKRHLTSMLSSPNNPYHADVATKIDPSVELKKVNAELADLKGRYYSPMRTEDRFEFAGLGDIYGSYYWQLCLDSHNSAIALETRHVVRNGEKFELVAVKPNSASDVWGYLDVMTALLLDSSIKLHQFLKSAVADAYLKGHQELTALRVLAYPEETTKGNPQPPVAG
jgi:hypothetical protein